MKYLLTVLILLHHHAEVLFGLPEWILVPY
jgi:hypothetical protein